MELYAKNVSFPHRRDKAAAVGRVSHHICGVPTGEVIAVDKIEIFTRSDTTKQGSVLAEVHLIPSDVRNTVIFTVRFEAAHLTVKPTQARVLSTLPTPDSEELHPQADTQKRDVVL